VDADAEGIKKTNKKGRLESPLLTLRR